MSTELLLLWSILTNGRWRRRRQRRIGRDIFGDGNGSCIRKQLCYIHGNHGGHGICRSSWGTIRIEVVMRRRWRWCRHYWSWLDQLLLCWRLFMMLFAMTLMLMMTRSRDTIGAIWRWECFWCVGVGGVGITACCGQFFRWRIIWLGNLFSFFLNKSNLVMTLLDRTQVLCNDHKLSLTATNCLETVGRIKTLKNAYKEALKNSMGGSKFFKL